MLRTEMFHIRTGGLYTAGLQRKTVAFVQIDQRQLVRARY